MAGELEVRDLRPEEMAQAVGVAARGMRDNPMHVAAYGEDPARRLVCHGRLMRVAFKHLTAQERLCAVRDGKVVAVAGVAPWGTCQPNPVQRLRLAPVVLGLGPRTAARLRRWLSMWAARDLDEPHVHLGPVAVDAHLQGQGIGSQVMAEHCRRLDATGETGYLETDKAQNVGFYERFGYEVIDSEPVIGVTTWYMRR